VKEVGDAKKIESFCILPRYIIYSPVHFLDAICRARYA